MGVKPVPNLHIWIYVLDSCDCLSQRSGWGGITNQFHGRLHSCWTDYSLVWQTAKCAHIITHEFNKQFAIIELSIIGCDISKRVLKLKHVCPQEYSTSQEISLRLSSSDNDLANDRSSFYSILS